MEALYRNGRYVLRFAFFVASNVYAIHFYLVAMTFLMPFRFFASTSPLYWKIEGKIFTMIESIVVSWIHSGGYRVLECGEDVKTVQEDGAVLLVNHQSTADTPLMMVGLYNKGSAIGRVMWVMYKLFKYTNFGAVSVHRQDFFIDQGKETRSLQLDMLRDHLKSSYLPIGRKWVVVFPEGGFLYKRLTASQEYAKKNDFPVLNYTTLPRFGALQTILDTVGELYEEVKHAPSDGKLENNNEVVNSSKKNEDRLRPLKWVIDVTLAYKGGEALDMLGMVVGNNPTNDTLLHWRAYRVKDIPREETALRDWLYDRYTEKEEILRAYYQEGVIPGVSKGAPLPAVKTQFLKFDLVEFVLNHIFFMVGSYLLFLYFWCPVLSVVGYLLSFVF